ncbi:hypothetical protein [Frankia sp. AvcI1]|uniref:hypothetical protein n=2 Tax=Frankia sp. AvcI1 TaxID=573496 RepID=UPI0021180461|nr:hypothetical protein [Frankia sp. AvcI1]
MITLTSADVADLSAVRTWLDLASYLKGIHRRSGMSLTELEKAGRSLARTDQGRRDLPTSSVSDALNGRRQVKKDLLESLLAAWRVSPEERGRIVDAWKRINATVGQGPANAGRVDEASPRELGVHPAISAPGAIGQLPSYVRRDFDGQLRDLVARGVEEGCFVLLVGGSSCGKTRSLYEAVSDLVPERWLVQPTRTQEIHDLLEMPTERTVLWLDELHRFLGADPPLRRADIITLVRRAKMIVVGTLWPDHYFARKRLSRGDGGDVYAEDRLLLDFADVISVPEALTPDERVRASTLAATDSRIQVALAAADAGLTQVLAAGPDLVNLWEQAPDPYSTAILSVAADARRLGVRSALSSRLLTEAMAGYLSRTQRVPHPESWLDRALRHATSELYGEVSALRPVSGKQVGSAGSVEGYEVADYLTQHIGRVRRCECPPHSLWAVLVTATRDPDDLRRLASTALARMRYEYAEPALRKLHQAGDQGATIELMTLLRRQDRLGEAMVVADDWVAADPRDQHRRGARAELIRLQVRVEQLREQAASDSGAGDLLAELLADGGQADAMRARVATGHAVAAEDLADLLAERGCVEELRELADSGRRFAAERLAELLSSLGRADELQKRADRGDPAAALYLTRPVGQNAASSGGDFAQLRAAADGGDEEAASELTALLFDAGDQAGLLDEVNAGTYLAAERYLALLTAAPEVDRHHIRTIRAFGLRADGRPADPAATL